MYYNMQSDRIYDDELAMEGFLGNIKEAVTAIIEKLIQKIIDLVRFVTKKKSIDLDDDMFEELKKTCGIKSKNISEFKSVLKKLHSEAQDIKKRIDTEKDESKLTGYKEEVNALGKKIIALNKALYSTRSLKASSASSPSKDSGSVSREVVNAVEEAKEGDFLSIRIMLKDSMVVDPTFKELNEMLSYVNKHVNVFVKHDNEELILDKSKWDKGYMDKEMVKIVRNFSHERFNLLKKVCQHIYSK